MHLHLSSTFTFHRGSSVHLFSDQHGLYSSSSFLFFCFHLVGNLTSPSQVPSSALQPTWTSSNWQGEATLALSYSSDNPAWLQHTRTLIQTKTPSWVWRKEGLSQDWYTKKKKKNAMKKRREERRMVSWVPELYISHGTFHNIPFYHLHWIASSHGQEKIEKKKKENTDFTADCHYINFINHGYNIISFSFISTFVDIVQLLQSFS